VQKTAGHGVSKSRLSAALPNIWSLIVIVSVIVHVSTFPWSLTYLASITDLFNILSGVLSSFASVSTPLIPFLSSHNVLHCSTDGRACRESTRYSSRDVD
jgi:hypothetical protein